MFFSQPQKNSYWPHEKPNQIKRPFTTEDEVELANRGFIRSLDDSLNRFRKEHASWLAKWNPSIPVYALPEASIRSLAKPLSNRVSAILSDSQTRAELAFTNLCEEFFCIGFFQHGPVRTNLFKDMEQIGNSYITEENKWCEFSSDKKASIYDHSELNRKRLRVYLARLWQNPEYLLELKDLKRDYDQLDESQHVLFPLKRDYYQLPLGKDGRITKPNCDCQSFMVRVKQFLDQYELMQLDTFDLATPQGPLSQPAHSFNSKLVSPNGRVLYIPRHSQFLTEEDIRNLKESFDRHLEEISKEIQIENNTENTMLYATYAQIMQLEKAIRQRVNEEFGLGVEEHIKRAISEGLGLKLSTISRYRSEIRSIFNQAESKITM